jgi:hypothetical protein
MERPVPEGWTMVSEVDFHEFLKTCPDYTRDAWVNCEIYKWKKDGKEFCHRNKNVVYVDPVLLNPT